MLKLAMRTVLAALSLTLTVAAPAWAAVPGGIDQLASPFGCLTNGGVGGCTSLHDMSRSFDLVVSPDGRNVYAPGADSDTIVALRRDLATGRLTQLPGNQGCIRNGPATATCRAGRFIDFPTGIAITPNGRTVYVGNLNVDTVLTFARDTTTGALTQLSGPAGCISNNNAVQGPAQCADARAMGEPGFLTVSGDGRHLYVAARGTDSVTALAIATNGTLSQVSDGSGGSGCVENTPSVTDGCADGRAMQDPFAISADANAETIYSVNFTDQSIVALGRDPATGRLSPVSGMTGCVDSMGTDGCATDADLGTVRDLAASPDGKHIYVPSDSTSRVLLYDRLASGGLVRRAGAAGCVSSGPAAGCTTGRGFTGPAGVIVSRDGADVYVAGHDGFGSSSTGLVELDRAANGVLTPRPGVRGCAVSGALPDCASVTGLGPFYDVKLSPDGRFVYVVPNFRAPIGFGVFRRDSSGPFCSSATYTVVAGTVTALRFPCGDVDGDNISTVIIAPPTLGSLGAIDNAADTVLYAAPQNTSGSTSFTFRSAYGAFQTGVGRITVNVQNPRVQPRQVRRIRVGLSYLFDAFSDRTVLRRLVIRGAPRGSRVRATCTYKGRKCASKARRAFTKKRTRGPVSLAKRFVGVDLPVGAKITMRVTKPGWIGGVKILTMRPRKAPKVTSRCTEPGKSKLKRRCG